ncbi:MAG: PAS domain-containing protein, partial [Tissierellaceae bacterium]
YLEKYGITSPPKVMWGVDDEIRALIKGAKLALTTYKGDMGEVEEKVEEAIDQVIEMIFKEDSILFPMCLDTLTEDEWIKIYNETEEIGYSLIEPKEKWKRARVNLEEKAEEESEGVDKGYVKFETGILSAKEINHIFNSIPGDMTFVDKDNIVKYFSQGKERLFARTKAVIGRTVENCHPPASVNVVEKIVNSFKSGEKDSESFWIQMRDKFVLIQYFAVRDENGEFLGTLEFSQDIAPIKELEGERRLLSE